MARTTGYASSVVRLLGSPPFVLALNVLVALRLRRRHTRDEPWLASLALAVAYALLRVGARRVLLRPRAAAS